MAGVLAFVLDRHGGGVLFFFSFLSYPILWHYTTGNWHQVNNIKGITFLGELASLKRSLS